MTKDATSGNAPLRSHGIAGLVDQTARVVQDMCWTGDMQASQWSALRYFGSAGEPARTVMGLAQYQGVNPGTASRTIAVLVRRGVLSMTVSPTDKRARVVSLTEAGTVLLAQDPLKTVAAVIAGMPEEAQNGLALGLRELLDRLLGVGGASGAAGGEHGGEGG